MVASGRFEHHLGKSTFPVTNQADSLGAILRRAGLSWGVRGGIETNTANGDFGAYIGLARGIDGAARAAVWSAGEMVRDIYTGAAKGEVHADDFISCGISRSRARRTTRRLKYVSN